MLLVIKNIYAGSRIKSHWHIKSIELKPRHAQTMDKTWILNLTYAPRKAFFLIRRFERKKKIKNRDGPQAKYMEDRLKHLYKSPCKLQSTFSWRYLNSKSPFTTSNLHKFLVCLLYFLLFLFDFDHYWTIKALEHVINHLKGPIFSS